jgi:hypothetical protein
MARKTTKGRKTAKPAKRRKTAKPAKKPRKTASKASVESSKAIDLLRGWSPSRYSGR